MIYTLPGTTIETDLSRPDAVESLLSPMFLAGGLMLSQISQLTGLEPYTIQNWVKRGFVSPPQNKRYTRRQFSRIAIINMLKDSLQIDKICSLLSYLNGHLDDESDDLIDDSELYCYIARVAGMLHQLEGIPTIEHIKPVCSAVLHDYAEPYPDARERIQQALTIIMTAYIASCLNQNAVMMLNALDQG